MVNEFISQGIGIHEPAKQDLENSSLAKTCQLIVVHDVTPTVENRPRPRVSSLTGATVYRKVCF